MVTSGQQSDGGRLQHRLLARLRTWGVAAGVGAAVGFALGYLVFGGPSGTVAPQTSVPSETPVPTADAARYLAGEPGFLLEAEEGFAADFPGEPQRSAVDGRGDVPAVTYVVATDAGVAYAVIVSGLTRPDGVSVEEVLAAHIEVLAHQFNGEVRSKGERLVSGEPGLEYLISHPAGDVRGVMLLHGSRLFQIQIGSQGDGPFGYDRFIDSFRFATSAD